jgi:YD repeat-containing protein
VKFQGYNPHLYYAYDWNHPLPTTTTWVYDGRWPTLQSTNAPPGDGWRGTTTVANGAGQTLYATTAVGDGRTIVSGWKVFDERGKPRLAAEPYYVTQLPPAPPADDVRKQTFTYDAASRLVEQALPNGAVKRTLFGITETSVFQVAQQPPELADVRSDLDGLGRVALTTRELVSGLESVSATYDAASRIKAMSLQSGAAVHQFEYDTLGRMYFASDPDTGDRHLCYDDRNLLVEHVNNASWVDEAGQPNGQKQHVFFEYDGVARLTRRGETPAPDSRTDYLFTYDEPTAAYAATGCHVSGRLASVVEPTGIANVTAEARHCYDVLGRPSTAGRTLVAAAGARTAWTKPELSPSGLLLGETFDDGVETLYAYDGAGRAKSITSDGSTLWQATDLDASGRVVDETYGNGASEQYVYDALGLTWDVRLRSTVGGQTRDLFKLLVTRTTFGAPKVVEDKDDNADSLNHSATYTYDDAARLKAATLGRAGDPSGGEYGFTFDYDHLQNMTFRKVTQGAMGAAKDIGVLTGTYKYGEGGYGPRQLTSVIPEASL